MTTKTDRNITVKSDLMAKVKCSESSPCISELSLDKVIEKRCLQPFETIDYVKDLISYEEFFLRYLLPNKPCILTPQVTQLWKSRTEWVTHDGKPNFEFLEKNFGSYLDSLFQYEWIKVRFLVYITILF